MGFLAAIRCPLLNVQNVTGSIPIQEIKRFRYNCWLITLTTIQLFFTGV